MIIEFDMITGEVLDATGLPGSEDRCSKCRRGPTTISTTPTLQLAETTASKPASVVFPVDLALASMASFQARQLDMTAHDPLA